MEKIFLVAPAYNEEAYIASFVDEWYPVVEDLCEEAQARLVVVNDGSKDDTGAILNELAREYPLLKVLHQKNGGHGAALLNGYRYAIEQGADYIFQTDSDGQTDPRAFPAFWKERHEYDAIFGMRPQRQDGKGRLFVENTLRLVVRFFFGVSVPDTNAPFRLMRADRVKEYLAFMPEDYNLPNVILTAAFAKKERPIHFQEITFKPRQGGVNSINMKRIWKIGVQALSDFREIRKNMD